MKSSHTHHATLSQPRNSNHASTVVLEAKCNDSPPDLAIKIPPTRTPVLYHLGYISSDLLESSAGHCQGEFMAKSHPVTLTNGDTEPVLEFSLDKSEPEADMSGIETEMLNVLKPALSVNYPVLNSLQGRALTNCGTEPVLELSLDKSEQESDKSGIETESLNVPKPAFSANYPVLNSLQGRALTNCGTEPVLELSLDKSEQESDKSGIETESLNVPKPAFSANYPVLNSLQGRALTNCDTEPVLTCSLDKREQTSSKSGIGTEPLNVPKPALPVHYPVLNSLQSRASLRESRHQKINMQNYTTGIYSFQQLSAYLIILRITKMIS
jgi:hypothetical protein